MPHSHQLGTTNLLNFSVQWYLIVILIRTCLMSNNVECIPTCSLVCSLAIVIIVFSKVSV